jgi:hypothetical protein
MRTTSIAMPGRFKADALVNDQGLIRQTAGGHPALEPTDHVGTLGLAVDKILPLLGRIVPFGDLSKAVGRQ